jgi:hypothetical protein
VILHDAYATLKRLGLVATHTTFSSIYLSKAPRYYDDLICSKRPPSVAALVSLFMRFQAIADAYSGSPSVAMQAMELNSIARRIWIELERRCCSLLPDHKRRRTASRAVGLPRRQMPSAS